MNCEFENIACAMPGNFTCKKCKACGHTVGMPTAVAEAQWPQVLARIKTSCANQSSTPPVAKLQAPPIAAPTFAAAAQKADANLSGISPNPSAPVQPYVDPTLQNVQDPFNPQVDETGPGSQLKKLLAKIGIKATPNCSCNAKAQHMNAMGADWCEQNTDLIVGWLREEAQKRGLPFVDMAGRMLVTSAISASRKAHANKLKKLNIPNALQ